MKVFEDDKEGQEEARKLAKRSCKECHGRGFTVEVLGGQKITDDTPRRKVLCSCAVKTLARRREAAARLTALGEDLGEYD